MTEKNSTDKGLDSVTDAMDAYLLNGVDAVDSWIGPATQHQKPEYAAAFMLGCAVIHAAETVAHAIDRHSAAIGLLIDAKHTA